jgi:hypothetical protein
MFVWTFEGVMQAIVLGVLTLFLIFIGGCFGLAWILETYGRWRNKEKRNN